MDPREFQRLLQQFPIVRSRNYCADAEKELSSRSAKDKVADLGEARNWMDKNDNTGNSANADPFWQKLRLAAERKVGTAKAEKFCEAVQRVHKKLVYEELSLDAARKFVGYERN